MLGTETLRLGDELDRLEERAADLSDGDADDTAVAQAQATQIDQRGRGVAWLVDEYGADAEIVVGGLDAGEFARVEDRVAELRASREGGASTPGAHRNVYAAMGVEAAPLLDEWAREHGPEDVDDWADYERDHTTSECVDAKLQAITTGVPVGVVRWLYARVDDLTTVDSGNWTPSDG